MHDAQIYCSAFSIIFYLLATAFASLKKVMLVIHPTILHATKTVASIIGHNIYCFNLL